MTTPTTTRETLLIGGSDAAFRELIRNLMTMAQLGYENPDPATGARWIAGRE